MRHVEGGHVSCVQEEEEKEGGGLRRMGSACGHRMCRARSLISLEAELYGRCVLGLGMVCASISRNGG